jgi:hypothetical protein
MSVVSVAGFEVNKDMPDVEKAYDLQCDAYACPLTAKEALLASR